MNCSVINCNNEATEYKKGRWYCVPCFDEVSEYSRDCANMDEVLVSEYEAYLAWFALEGFEIFSDITMEEYPLCTRFTIEEEMDEDEIRSALFGYWNEKVRR